MRTRAAIFSTGRRSRSRFPALPWACPPRPGSRRYPPESGRSPGRLRGPERRELMRPANLCPGSPRPVSRRCRAGAARDCPNCRTGRSGSRGRGGLGARLDARRIQLGIGDGEVRRSRISLAHGREGGLGRIQASGQLLLPDRQALVEHGDGELGPGGFPGAGMGGHHLGIGRDHLRRQIRSSETQRLGLQEQLVGGILLGLHRGLEAQVALRLLGVLGVGIFLQHEAVQGIARRLALLELVLDEGPRIGGPHGMGGVLPRILHDAIQPSQRAVHDCPAGTGTAPRS